MSKESASEKSSKPISPRGEPVKNLTGKSTNESPVHLVLRIIAIVLGLPLFAVAIGAWLALLIENAWIAFAVASAVVILPTLLLVDRLLPADDPRKGRGIPTDLLSMIWLGGAVLCFGPLASLLHAPLAAWSDRVDGSGTVRAILTFATETSAEPAPEQASEEATDSTQADDAGAPDAGAVTTNLLHAVEEVADEADAGAALDANEDAGNDAGENDAGNDAGSASANMQMSPADIFQAYAASVVSIEVQNGSAQEERRGGGTGFIIDTRGIVATNHHVIGNATNVRVKLLDGTYATSVELLSDNAHDDLALLRIQVESPLHSVRMGNSDEVVVGERAVVIGNPLGLEHTLSDGLVSARRRIEERNMIQMTAPVSPGNSGGPVFDSHGSVIGITTAVVAMGYGQNLNLAVPSNQLISMIRDEYPDRRAFGTPATSRTGGHW